MNPLIEDDPRFGMNEMARLKSDSSMVGVVRENAELDEGNFQYLIFFNIDLQQYVAEQKLTSCRLLRRSSMREPSNAADTWRIFTSRQDTRNSLLAFPFGIGLDRGGGRDRPGTPEGAVHLGVLPRIEFQRQVRLGPAHGLAFLPHIASHRTLSDWIPLLLDQLIDPAGGVALLAKLLLVFFQQLVNSLLVGPQDWRGPWPSRLVSGGTRVLDRLAHRPSTMAVATAYLANAHALDEICPPYRFDRFHLDHLLASARHRNAPW